MLGHIHIHMVDCLRHQHRQWSISLGMQSKRSSRPSRPAQPSTAILHNYFSMSGGEKGHGGQRTSELKRMQLPQTATEAIRCHQLCSAESLRKGKANKKLNLSTNLSKYLPSLLAMPSCIVPRAPLPIPFWPFFFSQTASSKANSSSWPIPIDAIEAGSSLFLFCGVSKEFDITQVQGLTSDAQKKTITIWHLGFIWFHYQINQGKPFLYLILNSSYKNINSIKRLSDNYWFTIKYILSAKSFGLWKRDSPNISFR